MKTLWLALCLLNTGVLCHANRDIVYAARYYTPPGSHRTSHFHLYRINPDGTGKTQLTFGSADDDDPQWSPDGKFIAFTRHMLPGGNLLCLIHANGGAIKTLMGPEKSFAYDEYQSYWSPDAALLAVVHSGYGKYGGSSASLIRPNTGQLTRRFVSASNFQWSPDGKYALIHFDKSDRIFALADGRQIDVLAPHEPDSPVVDDLVWGDSITLVGIAEKEGNTQIYLSAFGLNGKEKRSILCRWGNTTQDPYRDSIDPWGKSLLSTPPVGHSVVYVQDEGISSNRPDNVYYLADTLTGRMTKLVDGQFFVWSPDGTKFCTAEARHLANYGKPINGYQKSLYVAALQVGQKTGDRLHEITQGLSWVTEADWRKGK